MVKVTLPEDAAPDGVPEEVAAAEEDVAAADSAAATVVSGAEDRAVAVPAGAVTALDEPQPASSRSGASRLNNQHPRLTQHSSCNDTCSLDVRATV